MIEGNNTHRKPFIGQLYGRHYVYSSDDDDQKPKGLSQRNMRREAVDAQATRSDK